MIIQNIEQLKQAGQSCVKLVILIDLGENMKLNDLDYYQFLFVGVLRTNLETLFHLLDYYHMC